MTADKHARLVGEATCLKKAWLLCAAIIGPVQQFDRYAYQIPAYERWENKKLKRHIEDLRTDLANLARLLFLSGKASTSTVDWCALQFEAWQNAGTPIYDLGRFQDVEAAIGLLCHRRVMDCPPYAQVLLQGFAAGAAIRHPEYHLARDLALLWNLFLDAEKICDEALRQKVHPNAEYSQSLARSTIVTCYNLLESFVSGLGLAWRMENPVAASSAKFPDDMAPLHKRFFAVPAVILGRDDLLDRNQSPFAELFGDLKKRRDAFVHCEPGPKPTKHGHVKEEHFHDVELSIVRNTVDRTIGAIRIVWKAVRGSEGPSWLPMRGADGRFPRVDVVLVSSLQGKSLDVVSSAKEAPGIKMKGRL